MSSDEIVSFSLEVNVEEAYTELRKLQTVLYRSLDIARKLGLPDDISEMASKIQRLIAITNQLRLALIALSVASGPLGWALALVGTAGAFVSAGSFFDNEMRGR